MNDKTLHACPHCSGAGSQIYHGGTCPRIKAIEYYESGTIRRVEFHGEQAPPSTLPQLPFPVKGATTDTSPIPFKKCDVWYSPAPQPFATLHN